MAEPKCPECGVVGADHLVSKESKERSNDREPWFNIVFCDQCGHVYGLYSKVIINPERVVI